jgi:hypothetical protein
MPVTGYRTTSEYVYEALAMRKRREEIMQILIENGYTKLQAMNIYHMYRARFFGFRQRLEESKAQILS